MSSLASEILRASFASAPDAIRDQIRRHRREARQHAVLRAMERGPGHFCEAVLSDHESRIRQGSASHVGRGVGGNQRQLYTIVDGCRAYHAVFCPRLDCIVTYLAAPREWRGKLLSSAGRA